MLFSLMFSIFMPSVVSAQSCLPSRPSDVRRGSSERQPASDRSIHAERRMRVYPHASISAPALTSEDTPQQTRTFRGIPLNYLGSVQGSGMSGYQLFSAGGTRTKPGATLGARADLEYKFWSFYDKQWFWRRHTPDHRFRNIPTGCNSSCPDDCSGGHTRRVHSGCRWSSYRAEESDRDRNLEHVVQRPITQVLGRYWLWEGDSLVEHEITREINTPFGGYLVRTTAQGLRDFGGSWSFEMRADAYTYRHILGLGTRTKDELTQFFNVGGFFVHPYRPTANSYSISRGTSWTSNMRPVTLRFNWTPHTANRSEESYYIEYYKFFEGYIKMAHTMSLLRNIGSGDVSVFMDIGDGPKIYTFSTNAPGDLIGYPEGGGAAVRLRAAFDINLDGQVGEAEKKTLNRVLDYFDGSLNDVKRNQHVQFLQDYNNRFTTFANEVSKDNNVSINVGNLNLVYDGVFLTGKRNGKTISQLNVVGGDVEGALSGFRHGLSKEVGEDLSESLLDAVLNLADVTGNGAFTNEDMARFDDYAEYGGVIFTDLAGNSLAFDVDSEHFLKTGGIVSVMTGPGASSVSVNETFGYSFHKPRIWAVDTNDGNQLSPSVAFTPRSDEIHPVPKPDYEIISRPESISCPDVVPGQPVDEDKTITWTANTSGEVMIKPGTYNSTWLASNGDTTSQTSPGSTFDVKFLTAGHHYVTYSYEYYRREIVPITDNLGVIIHKKPVDIYVSGSFTSHFTVENHDAADFELPVLFISAYGDNCSYAYEYASKASYNSLLSPAVQPLLPHEDSAEKIALKLRKRDFPATLQPYSLVPAIDVKSPLQPKYASSSWVIDEYVHYDEHIDLVDAQTTYKPRLNAQLKFARRVHDVEDLREHPSMPFYEGHVEAYGGINPEEEVTIKATLMFHEVDSPDSTGVEKQTISGVFSGQIADFTGQYGSADIEQALMTKLLVKDDDGRFIELDILEVEETLEFALEEPTFYGAAYELVIEMNFTKREYIVDDFHGNNAARIAARGGVANNDGRVRQFDEPATVIWKRKVYTVDIEPPTIISFMQTDEQGNWVDIPLVTHTDGTEYYRISATTGDEIRYKVVFSDDHPAFGPNDGRKNDPTKAPLSWYPRFWAQQIVDSQFTNHTHNGYEMPLIQPTIASLAQEITGTQNDGVVHLQADNHQIERFDGNVLSVHSPPITTLGTNTGDQNEIVFQHRFSPYISGNMRFKIDIEDSSRNVTELKGRFNIVDNKRPNLDIRLVSSRYGAIPERPHSEERYIDRLDMTDAVFAQYRPPSPGLNYSALVDRLAIPRKESITIAPFHIDLEHKYFMLYGYNAGSEHQNVPVGLAFGSNHTYYEPDMYFDDSGNYVNLFGSDYDRTKNLQDNVNLPLTESTTNNSPVIYISDANIRDSFRDKMVNRYNVNDEWGFGESELLYLDVAIRDNVLFRQCDNSAPLGRFVIGQNILNASYTITEDVRRREEHASDIYQNVIVNSDFITYNNELKVPPRLVEEQGRPLFHVFRHANAYSHSESPDNAGLIKGGDNRVNRLSVEVTDLEGNIRRLNVDLPILPRPFDIRTLEQDSIFQREQ